MREQNLRPKILPDKEEYVEKIMVELTFFTDFKSKHNNDGDFLILYNNQQLDDIKYSERSIQHA